MTTEDALKELLKKSRDTWTNFLEFEGSQKTLKLETKPYGTLCKAAKEINLFK